MMLVRDSRPHRFESLIGSTDDWFVIIVTDANFSRYGIAAEDLQRAMTRHAKVHTALICIGEGAEALWYVLRPLHRAHLTQ